MVAGMGAPPISYCMSETPAFLDGGRPPVPDIVVPRGVTPFLLPHRPVHGRIVRLGLLADALLTRHANHPVVTALTGQALALAAALSTALKFEGSFSLQAKGDGPVRLLLADCTDTGALRGYAQMDSARLEALLATDPTPSAEALLGKASWRSPSIPGPVPTATRASWRSKAPRWQKWRCITSAPASNSVAWFTSPATARRMAGAPLLSCWKRLPARAASIRK